jgi:hypothetical protein
VARLRRLYPNRLTSGQLQRATKDRQEGLWLCVCRTRLDPRLRTTFAPDLFAAASTMGPAGKEGIATFVVIKPRSAGLFDCRSLKH